MQNRVFDVERFKELWAAGTSLRDISEDLGVGADVIGAARRRLGLPPRNAKTRAKKRQEVDPTPEEIRQRAAEIRSRWDEETFRRRAGVIERPFEFPVVGLDEDYWLRGEYT